MGGGGFLGLGPAPSAPAAPDYTGAAQQTAQGNVDAARTATAANRVNQVTPYGNLNYSQTGADQYGNPTWTATTNLSDVGQQLLNNQNNASLGLGSAINSQLGNVQNVMGGGFNPNIPQTQTSLQNQGGMQGWDKANAILQARLQPQMAQDRESQNANLANQGIVAGTQAYDNAMRTFNQGQNDLLTNSQLAGANLNQNLFTQGLQGAQFGNTAQQQAYNQALTNYNLPLNTLSALRTGAQVQNPSFINAPQQATTSGADILGATTATGNYNMAGFNASNAAQSGFNSGLMGLGGTLGAAAIMSDIRTKENIEPIGVANNGLTVYKFEYKDEFKDHKLAGHGVHYGYMAQEVEQVYPYAVHTLDDGYKVINYGVLNA
jgi:hypothetical protein